GQIDPFTQIHFGLSMPVLERKGQHGAKRGEETADLISMLNAARQFQTFQIIDLCLSKVSTGELNIAADFQQAADVFTVRQRARQNQSFLNILERLIVDRLFAQNSGQIGEQQTLYLSKAV